MGKFVYYSPIEGEELIPIEGFEDLYAVTNKKRVISLSRIVVGRSGSKRICRVNILAQHDGGDGYLRVILTDRFGKRHNKIVSRLVCAAFNENTQDKLEVNHKYGDKEQNYPEDLEWSTRSENCQHAKDMGLSAIGEKCNFSKITKEVALEIFNSNGNRKEIAKKYGVSKGCIDSIKQGVSWSQTTGKKHRKKNNRLTDEQVKNIYLSIRPNKELAELYGVCRAHINRIKKGRVRLGITNHSIS